MSTEAPALHFMFPEETPVTEVRIGVDLRHALGALTRERFPGGRPYLLVDPEPWSYWSGSLLAGFDEAPFVHELPRGESCKTAEQWAASARALLQAGARRTDFLVAVGGGATCDLAGSVAASLLRGIPVVHVPTTLLGMVDAGLGGKCAVNLPEGKNLLGFFHHPRLLVVDPEFLRTLPAEELRAGFGEICKYGIGFSDALFDSLREAPFSPDGAPTRAYGNAPASFWEGLVHYCLTIKGNLVSEDPRERAESKRILLNLGHTAAHGFETLAARRGQRFAHGLAVGLGLRVALDVSRHLGRMPESEVGIANALLDRFEQPQRWPFDPIACEDAELADILGRDKKRIAEPLRIVLPLPGQRAQPCDLPLQDFVRHVRRYLD